MDEFSLKEGDSFVNCWNTSFHSIHVLMVTDDKVYVVIIRESEVDYKTLHRSFFSEDRFVRNPEKLTPLQIRLHQLRFAARQAYPTI